MKTFKNLIINGRPACGKSEFIDLMKKTPENERKERFHIGKFEEIDDFPWIWSACEEDDKREAKGEKRLYSEKTPECYNLTVPNFRGGLISKMNELITEKYLKSPSFYENNTLLIEFARGKGDGFKESLTKFKKEILETSAILHIKVTFEESYRRNDARYKKGLESSILSHKVPDKDMYEYFIENDWEDVTNGAAKGYLTFNGVSVPFITLNNMPELKDPVELGARYQPALSELYDLFIKRR